MITNWQEQNKDLVDTGYEYDDSNIMYDQSDVRYGGQETPIWTEQIKN
jgi:hypothetical protein